MKKVIEFLSAPIVNAIIGLLLYIWIGCCIWQYVSFDRYSAFYGGLTVIAIDIFGYGFNALVDQFKAKSKKEKVIVHGRTYEIDPDQDDSAE